MPLHHRLPRFPLPSTVAVSPLPRPIYEESISPFASRVSQRMTHWWGLISPKCAKGEGERQYSRSKRRRERGREDKCNGLAIKRKVDGMHTEEQNMGGKVGRAKGREAAYLRMFNASVFNSQRHFSLPAPSSNDWSAAPSRMQSLASRVTFI